MAVDLERVIFTTARQAPSGCETFSMPIAAICELGEFKREDMLRAIPAEGVEVHDLRLTIDFGSDRVLYERTENPIPTLPRVVGAGLDFGGQSTAAAAAKAPAPVRAIDPADVARQARTFQESERKAGRQISTTDAVARVIAQQRRQ